MNPSRYAHEPIPVCPHTYPGFGKTDLGFRKSDLGIAKSDLGNVKSELGNVKSELGNAKSHPGNAPNHPFQAQTAHLPRANACSSRVYRQSSMPEGLPPMRPAA